MKEEGGNTPSSHIARKEHVLNLCINGEDAKQVGEGSWGIVIYERGVARELSF
jgi:hypothetical protein